MMKCVSILVILIGLIAAASDLSAENYVNWRGGFWLEIPENWEKVDYRLVDAFLSMTDTSLDVFKYEAVFAPSESEMFAADAYLVITFDSTGQLSKAESDSVLESIGESYSTAVYDAPIVELMSDLVPGKPKMNRAEKTVSILYDMAYRPEAMKRLWLYMKLNDRGLISLYFYSPDSTFESNKPIFDQIVTSLSFENLKQAAEGGKAVFTEVGGENLDDPEMSSGRTGEAETGSVEGISKIKNILLIAVIIIIVFGLIWNFLIAPKMKKKKTQSD
jgi:hypothetical protein